MVRLHFLMPCLGRDSFEESDEDRKLSEFAMPLLPREVSPHPLRWFVLALYCAASFTQVVIWNTWGPIARSAMFAFPTWDPHTVALLSTWGSLTYVVGIIPICWLLSERGLRMSFLTACFLSLVGVAVRCCGTNNEKIFTVLAHIGAILNGMSGVILCPAPAMLSALWFPQDQRTSATGIGAALNQLGMAGSYLIGPIFVSTPTNYTFTSTVAQKKIRSQISALMLFHFLIFATVSTIMFTLFPERPPQPPSRTALVERLNFKAAVKTLLWSWNMWLLSTAAALCQGVTGPWLSMITVIFSSEGVTQDEADKLGVWTVVCSCLMGISIARASDVLQGYLKFTLMALIVSSSAMFLWVLLLTTQAIPFHKTCLYIAVLLGVSFSWSTPPLFFELAAEIAYPVPEGIVGGYIAALANISSSVFFFVYFIPGIGIMWMNYCLLLYSLGSLVAMALVEERYNRMSIDKGLLEPSEE